MKTRTLEIKCESCNTPNSRTVKLYDPEVFSKNGTQSVLSQFWCIKCGTVQALRYEFYRDKNKEIQTRVKCQVDSKSIASPKEAPTGLTVRPKAGKFKNR